MQLKKTASGYKLALSRDEWMKIGNVNGWNIIPQTPSIPDPKPLLTLRQCLMDLHNLTPENDAKAKEAYWKAVDAVDEIRNLLRGQQQ